jgi:hypothetical protein
MTYYIALALGLGEYKSYWRPDPARPGKGNYTSEAYAIAWACAYIDVNSATEPLQFRAIEKAVNARYNAALWFLPIGVPQAISA